jgi:hypothetical protein
MNNVLYGLSAVIFAILIGGAAYYAFRKDYGDRVRKIHCEAEAEYHEARALRNEMIVEQERLVRARAAELVQNRNRDKRIEELKAKNAELTARLCNRLASGSKDWSEPRKKRAGKKLGREIAPFSEGCARWCLEADDGKAPDSDSDV